MSTQTILYIILAGIGALLFAIFQYYFRSKKNTKQSLLFAFLRFLSVFGLLLLLINPKFKKQSYYNEKPTLVVAVDNSSSIKELGFDEAVTTTAEAFRNNKELQEKFDIEYYMFDKTLNEQDSLTFTGKQTNIASIVTELGEINKNNTAPFVLVTDGNQTYGNDYQFINSKVKQPIFPIIIGDTIVKTDLAITQLNANKYAYHKNKFPVEIILNYTGKQSIYSRLVVSSGNTVLSRQNVAFSPENNSRIVNLNLPANSTGIQRLRAHIVPIDAEKNTANNTKYFAVEVIDQKVNIALVSDILHPDLGTLKKSIESNVLRSVDLLKPNEVISKIDDYQLLVLYQPNASFSKVYAEINRLQKSIFTITGTKTDWRFLNTAQSQFSKKAISETEDVQANLNTNFNTFIIDNPGFAEFPPLENTFGEVTYNVKEDAILFQSISGIATNQSLLSILEYDGTKSALLLGENLWKWRAQSYLQQGNFQKFDDFIGKLVQYVSSTKKRERLTVSYESFYNGSSEIILSAQYFNASYEFDSKANLTAILKDKASGATTTYPLVLNTGFYSVDVSNLPPSEYTFTIRVDGQGISKSGTFTILEFDIEKQFLNADVDRLKAIATKTEGKHYFINDTSENIISDLLNDDRFKTIEKSKEKVVSLIDWKYVLAFIVFCLALEWFARKYFGLI